MDFTNKTVIATGAGSGIAKLYLENVASLGATAVFVDVNKETAEAAAKEVTDKGFKALAYAADVRNPEDICNVVDDVLAKTGRIDILLNSAGGASKRVWKQPDFSKASFESIEWGIDVNLKGAVLFARAVLPAMEEQKSGLILNMSSVDGITGSRGSVDYGAAKAGMIGLSKSIAIYGAPNGIRSVSVAPGPVLTRANMANMTTLLGRAAETQEVVDLLLFLSSDKATFITGCNYQIDGGRPCNVGR